MKLVNGWWCPDYDDNLNVAIKTVPSFAGRSTYMLKWFLRCTPYIRDFRHAVDVGAHIGLWSWPMSRCFVKVTAFEPVNTHAECFMRNLNGFANVTLRQLAIGAAVGEVDMAIKPPWSVKARVRTKEVGAPNISAMTTLDDAVDPDGLDFLKIDCEGYELRVIEGGERVIRSSKPLILIEQKPLNVVRYGFGQQAIELLQDWGATVHWEAGGDFCMGWV